MSGRVGGTVEIGRGGDCRRKLNAPSPRAISAIAATIKNSGRHACASAAPLPDVTAREGDRDEDKHMFMITRCC